MKVQTKAGEVAADFSNPENVRKGMLFRVPTDPTVYGVAYRDIVAACDGNFGIPDGTGEFLGCHPEIARREDCERFGIAPGIDAGAHGFAQLSGGGAVDLYDEAPIGMVYEYEGARFTVQSRNCGTRPGVHHLGLDARYARPKDVERMCCGGSEVREEDGALWRTGKRCTRAIGHSGEHEDLATGARWSARPLKSIGETLTFGGAMRSPSAEERAHAACFGTTADMERAGVVAISGAGSRAQEVRSAEDVDRLFGKGSEFGGKVKLGMGWAAIKAADAGIVQMARAQLGISSCPGCGAANGAACPESCPDMQRRRAAWEATHCGACPKPGQRLAGVRGDHRPAFGDERCANRKPCNGEHDAPFRGPYGSRWTDDAPLVGCSRCAAPVIPTAKQLPMSVIAQDETGAHRPGWLCEACAGRREDVVWRGGRLVSTADEQAGLGAVALLAWCCKADGFREQERRAREAPLVALVAAVPEGLDPGGWRSAVLAYCEQGPDYREALLSSEGMQRDLATALRMVHGLAAEGRPWVAFNYGSACTVYARAIAPPGPRPEPFRRKAPGLPVDDGRDA